MFLSGVASPFLSIALALSMTACAGPSPNSLSGLTAETLVAANEPAVQAVQFTPFADPPMAPAGGREVIANPTLADIMQAGPLPEMSWGRADAPVTIVQYASLTCPHCRSFHQTTFPDLKRLYIDTGKVRYILREFPIGKSSGNATIALRCAPPEKYLDLYGKFMSQQANWVAQEVRLDAIFAVASQVGMTRSEFDACLANQGMIEALKTIKDRGRKLGVIGTPNFFVQGALVKSQMTLADIRARVEPLLASRP